MKGIERKLYNLKRNWFLRFKLIHFSSSFQYASHYHLLPQNLNLEPKYQKSFVYKKSKLFFTNDKTNLFSYHSPIGMYIVLKLKLILKLTILFHKNYK